MTASMVAGEIRAMASRTVITVEPGKRGGQPCIRGLRITVYDVLDLLAAGVSEDSILADYPDLKRDDIGACRDFAAERLGRPADPAAPRAITAADVEWLRVHRVTRRGQEAEEDAGTLVSRMRDEEWER